MVGDDGAIDRARVARDRLRRPGEARLARGAAAPARLRRVPALARAARRAAESAGGLRHRGAAPLRGRRRERFDKVVVITAPAKLREPAPRRARRARAAPAPRRGEGGARGLRLREHGTLEELDACVGGVMAELTRSRLEPARSLALLGSSSAASPSTCSRRAALVRAAALPAPLRADRRGHAENYQLDPPLLAAVIYQESKFDADAVSTSGAIGLMQLLPATRRGSPCAPAARLHRATSRPGDQHPLRRVVPPPPARQVRRRGARARRLQRGPGERRPLARRGRRDPVPGDAALRRARAGAEGDLRRTSTAPSSACPEASPGTSLSSSPQALPSRPSQLRRSEPVSISIRAMHGRSAGWFVRCARNGARRRLDEARSAGRGREARRLSCARSRGRSRRS